MLRWGLIGAGEIARVFACGMRFTDSGRVTAVASQTPGKAQALARDFDIPKHYDTYEALLADREIDAVYISTIHPYHAAWTIKAAQAGKHILVEKPMAMNAREAAAMIEAARAGDVFLMEAFMYRCHPQTPKMAEMVREGAVGRVQVVRAIFSYGAPFSTHSRAYNKAMGGGGILDVGCYTASMARLLAGAGSTPPQPFANPISVKASGYIGATGVDHVAAATLQFESGIIGEIITGVSCSMPTLAAVYGETGSLTVTNPWLPSTPCRRATTPLPPNTVFPPTTILYQPNGQKPQEITIEPDRDLYSYEADMVAAHIADRQAPAMRWADSQGNMELLDRWRAEIGLQYAQDEA
jgi:predicted dehydrogenase